MRSLHFSLKNYEFCIKTQEEPSGIFSVVTLYFYALFTILLLYLLVALFSYCHFGIYGLAPPSYRSWHFYAEYH